MNKSLVCKGLKKACLAAMAVLMLGSCQNKGKQQNSERAAAAISTTKPVIYQVFVRLFGNQNLTNHFYGSIEQNGVGKFNDITGRALDSIKALGVTHIWYTGVLEHATMTDYSRYGIQPDDPDVVKGRAGSPYAVKDYYDVDPDLASNVDHRLLEFDSLIARTHKHGLKVIMDFIPNHVARSYHSDKKPAGIVDFGAKDDKSLNFSANNDFYYLPGTAFKVPAGVDAGGPEFTSALKDGRFAEVPAKVTGNNVLRPDPSIDDWYETVKLNYGIDLFHGDSSHFNPMPPVWTKMRDILFYWAGQRVDGFRCDMAEMVPLPFWSFVIAQVKAKYPDVIFIAEAYDPQKYAAFTKPGTFDYLYNKVGLYDALKPIIKNDSGANTAQITQVLNQQRPFAGHMLNFLENHDEERIASNSFAGDAFWGEAAMGVAATVGPGPVLLYFGQELGVSANEAEGFGGADGRTTLFDYWGIPVYQHWVNEGKFDGGHLDDRQRSLRAFYQSLFRMISRHSVMHDGKLSVIKSPGLGKLGFAYLRYNQQETLFFAANFNHKSSLHAALNLPDSVSLGAAKALRPLLSNTNDDSFALDGNTIEIELPAGGFQVWRIR
ncbi:Glycosidase [Arachidicoccus rhizosphaerae]|uniref:Glycosidase n=1 Tax=Arachidicoccus rhizosphaerae TaxID=551991 RepID=A0A1H3ZLT6_9BACT|nr:alpha-amylase family protein [Arachidicoccus rhizosphaerae]SEA24766.1 Glycosidase [Arachidicoccus rhizosphaerae]